VTDPHPEGSGDQYQSLGLTVLSRHGVAGLGDVIATFRSNSRKVKVVQLVTALSLLFFVLTDMLPTVAVVLSGFAILVAATVAGRRTAAAAASETESLLNASTFVDENESTVNAVSDQSFLKGIVESGVATLGNGLVVNVDSDELVLCSKVNQG
jgi:hypothetical protein